MKRNKKITIRIILCILILVISIATYLGIQYSNGIEFTQLSDQGPRQMMGYIIKTKNDDVIVVDRWH